MFKDLFTYEELYEACAEYFQFGDVTFLRDFGPWKKGQNVETLAIMIDGDPVMEEYSNEGKTSVIKCNYSLVAIV